MFPRWLWLRSTGFPFGWLEEQASPGLLDLDGGGADAEELFAAATLAARRALVARVNEPEVAEALLMSNPAAVDRTASLRTASLYRPNVRTRQRLRLSWAYLQRFCAKNETIGCYGPLAWGTVDPVAPEPLATMPVDPSAGRLLRRSVRVEHWVLCALADALARTEPDLPARLNPGCDLDGNRLRIPLGRCVALSDETANLIHRITSGRARRVPRALVDAGVVHRAPAVPPESPGGPLAIEAAVGRPVPLLGRLEELRRRFERAAGVLARRRLLEDMRSLLTSVDIDTTRAAATMYAGRHPVYEDCERNLRLRVGGRLAAVLTEQLPPLLRLFRLAAECVASELHAHYLRVFSDVAGQRATDGAAEVDFMVFLHSARAAATTSQVRAAVALAVRGVLDSAWARIGSRRDEAELTDDQLEDVAARLRARFPGHRRFAGVLGVGVMSPDVLVDGRGAEVVLGEVHPCVAAIFQPVALPFMPDADEALTLADEQICGGRAVLATTDAAHHRSQFTWPVTRSFSEIVIPGATSRCPPDRTIPAGRGRVRVRDGIVWFADRATDVAEDMVTVLSSDLQSVMFRLAGAILGGDTTARLRYRDVVVRRRAWTPARADFPEAPRPAEALADYLALREWATAVGLPRRAFFRTDTEDKPIYLDWANPIAVDTFTKVVRGATSMRITEFAPGPDDLWLTDDLGAHTAELRTTYLVTHER